jgi:hypothetical protein
MIFAHYRSRIFVIPQANELDVPNVFPRCPLQKLEVSHKLGTNPNAFCHLLSGQSLPPSSGASLRKVHKRTSIDAAALQLRK